jgi:hypothetical protein
MTIEETKEPIEGKQPSREEMVTWYTEQIQLAELRATLSKHQRDIAVNDAERYEAMIGLDMMQNPAKYQAPEQKESAPIRNLKKQ